MLAGIVLSCCSVLLLVYVIWIYNRLIAARNLANTAFNDIDIQLHKRAQLVPQLVDLTRQYLTYESAVLLELSAKRVSGFALQSDETLRNDLKTSDLIAQFRVQSEDYPQLQANHSFLQLMEMLVETENHLLYARRFYNGTVRSYSILTERFPSSVIARISGFGHIPYYSGHIENP